MRTYQWSCCQRIDAPDQPGVNNEIVVIEGLLTPPISAESRGEALSKLNQWFIDNMCLPYREVT